MIDRIVITSADLTAATVRRLRTLYPRRSVRETSRRARAGRRSIVSEARRRAALFALRLSVRAMRILWRSAHTPVGRRLIQHWLDTSGPGRSR